MKLFQLVFSGSFFLHRMFFTEKLFRFILEKYWAKCREEGICFDYGEK